MKKFLILMMTGLLVIALSAGTAWAKPDNGKSAMKMYKTQYKAMVNGKISVKGNQFKDTANHWGSASIQRMTNLGLFAGYNDGTFKPNNQLSQAEMIALVMRLVDYNSNDDEEDSVSDNEKYKAVPVWARNSVKQAVNLRIMSLNRFHSAQQASRAVTCVAFAKALGLDPIDIDDVNFSDKLLINKEDLGYILAMYKEGYIKGTPGNYFLPQNCITRAEMATILERILANLREDDVDFSDLETDLLDDYDEIEAVPVDNINLDGDEDEVDVEVEVDLDDYEDEWADLDESDIEDWLEDLVEDIQDELSEDTIVNGEIINIDNDDVLVSFSKDGPDDLSVSYYDVDLSDLETDLLDDYDEIEAVPVDNINLDGDEDEVDVEVEVDLDDYEDEWADLDESDIEDWLEDLVEDIQDELSEDTIVNGEIINIDNDDVLVSFSKDGTDDLSVSYYDKDDVNDVEDELKGDEFDIAGIEFQITSINYHSNDMITVILEAQENVSSSEWEDLDSSDVENDVENICEDIAQAFQDDADAEPVMIYISLHDDDSYLLESYNYDVEEESLD